MRVVAKSVFPPTPGEVGSAALGRDGVRIVAVVGGVLIALVLSMGTTLPAVAAPPDAASRMFPAPLEGPGHPTLARSEQKQFDKSLRQLSKGNVDKAKRTLQKSGSGPAQQLLQLHIDYRPGSPEQIPSLSRLTDESRGYAAGWVTLYVVANRAGDEATAYDAAARVLELWPGSNWANRAHETRRQLVDDRFSSARKHLAEGDAGLALDLANRGLELDGLNRDGLMIRARALVKLEKFDEANAVLANLGNDPEALMLAGRAAEMTGDLVTAMDRYGAAPPNTPGRDVSLRRAQMKWRLSVLPTYVQQALESDQVTRSDLAVLLVNLVPQLEALGGGTVPLLSDILDLPSHREIVTAARLELLTVDRLEHRFNPDRVVDITEFQAAINRLSQLTKLPRPSWCDPSNVVSSCVELVMPISGRETAEMVMNMVHGEGP
jgi:hypothetical protein